MLLTSRDSVLWLCRAQTPASLTKQRAHVPAGQATQECAGDMEAWGLFPLTGRNHAMNKIKLDTVL